jgi:hypothetical protein
MLRLIANDFRLNAVFVFWVFLLSNVQLVLMAWLGGPWKYLLGGLQSGIAFGSAMVIAVFLREEQNKGQVINRSLPISHAKVVYARYLSVALFVIANVLYGLFYQRVVFSPKPIFHVHSELYFQLADSFLAIEHSLVARTLVVTMTISIVVPLIIRYGTFWRILIGYVVVIVSWLRCVPYLIFWSNSSAHVFGWFAWILLVVVLMIVMLGVSIRLSTWLYGRKDL